MNWDWDRLRVGSRCQNQGCQDKRSKQRRVFHSYHYSQGNRPVVLMFVEQTPAPSAQYHCWKGAGVCSTNHGDSCGLSGLMASDTAATGAGTKRESLSPKQGLYLPCHPPRMEGELFAVGGLWSDLCLDGADRDPTFIFACLDSGVLEAWRDEQGAIRIYLPESLGGHLVLDSLDGGLDLQSPEPFTARLLPASSPSRQPDSTAEWHCPGDASRVGAAA